MTENSKALDILIDRVISIVDSKNKKLYYDKTFPSVVYGVNSDGTYTIIKDRQKYNVKCAVSATLSLGSHVWVKIPCGRLHEMHICGVR